MGEAPFSPRMIRVLTEIQGFIAEPDNPQNCWTIRKPGGTRADFEVLQDGKCVYFRNGGVNVAHNWTDFWIKLYDVANKMHAEHFRLSRDYAELQAAVLEVL